MRMRSKITLGTVMVMGWLVSGIPPAEAGGFNTCMNELLKQGVFNPVTQCWPCRDNPDLPICQIQGSGAKSGGSSGGSSSIGGGGSSTAHGGDEVPSNVLEGFNAETGEPCLQVKPAKFDNQWVTVHVYNTCTKRSVEVENVCGSLGMRPQGGGKDSTMASKGAPGFKLCEK